MHIDTVPVCLSQVGTAVFDDGKKVTYWMSPEGFQKMTSLCPCACWMAKAGVEEKKAVFKTGIVESPKDFCDAWPGLPSDCGASCCCLVGPWSLVVGHLRHGVQRTVHMTFPFMQMRDDAQGLTSFFCCGSSRSRSA